MSTASRARKHAAKAARFDAIVASNTRWDDASGDEHRRMAAHAHVMTHHALEMDTPEAHEAAAQAHDKVAEMHRDAAQCMDSEDAPQKSATSGRAKAKNS